MRLKYKKLVIAFGMIGGFLQIAYCNEVQARSILKGLVRNLSPQTVIVAQHQNVDSQPLEGSWIGTFTQNREPRKWNMRLNLSQERGMVEGTSVHEPIVNGEFISVVYELKGMFSDNVFEFIEGKMLERNASSGWRFCGISGKLDLLNLDGRKILKGYWECFYNGERFFGKVLLRRL
jgi:hypothetical protein